MTTTNSNTNSSSGSIGLAGLLGVAFIVLKLAGTIDWSWVWVLAPFWVPLAIGGAIFIVAALVAIVKAVAR